VNQSYDIGIVGGGLAGLTASIHLSKLGFSVLLIERQSYPHHRVCGEYVSNEVLPYLNSLEIQLPIDELPKLSRLQLTTQNGKELNHNLPLGGFGISRYKLDELLYKKAQENSVEFVFEKVEVIKFYNNEFLLSTSNKQSFIAKFCLGAWGKRSSLDKSLVRPFIQKKTSWMAVKCHYKSDFDDDLIALHNFRGGYCGMSKIEDSILNACYLVDTNVFQEYGNVDDLEKMVIRQNPFWSKWREKAEPIFEKPLVISQISFDQKEPVKDHILMIGDTAGLIHPLCGNGMAMAIHSAKLAVDCIANYKYEYLNRQELETNYSNIWNETFKSRLTTGRRIQALLLQQRIAPHLLTLAQMVPGLVPKIIRKTHGKSIVTTL